MSFWRTFGFHTVSAVENILDRESFTLEELLDEDEILQEVKSQNKKLLDFLTQPPTLLKLFEFVSKDCGEEADPKRRFKYPFLACEILCSEIWVLTEAIFRDESLLNVLFSFLDQDQPLNPLLASYTSRVAIFLLARRTAEVLAYIKKQDNIIPKFISYLGSASVMELLLKIIGSEESPEGAGVIQWLCGTDLVSSLLSKFDPSQDTDVHENAGQTLSDIIQISSHLAGSPLLAQLESEAFVNQLFKYILSGSNSVMLHGMTVLIELLKRHARDVHDDNAKLQDLSPLLSISMSHLEQFNTFLRSPPPQSPMLTTFGSITPLGFYRLKVVDFYQALMRTRYTCIDEVFVKLEILNTCLDLFFEYPWNNFLHATVEFIIQNVLEGRNDQLKIALLTQAKLLDRIVEANKRNLQEEVKPRSSRLGFMGFLTTISLSIANAAAASPKLEEMLEANSDWKTYVNTSLSEIRTIETKPLGGHRPANIPIGENSEDENDPDTDSIFDRYKLGFTDDFPDDNGEDEYDDTDMNQYGDSGPFDSTAAFNSYDKSFLYDNEMLHDANSDDSDDDTAEGQEGAEWPQKQIADVGSSPTEEAGFDKRVLNHENTNQQSQGGSQTTNDVFSNSHASS